MPVGPLEGKDHWCRAVMYGVYAGFTAYTKTRYSPLKVRGEASAVEPDANMEKFTPKEPKGILDFIEHPLTLTALFALGGLVGTLIYTPFYILCAVGLLLGLHRSGYVSTRAVRVQVGVYVVAAVVLAVGGYFLYGLLDAAVQRVQDDFARKVAALIKQKPSEVKEQKPLPEPGPGEPPKAPPSKPAVKPKPNAVFSVAVEIKMMVPGPSKDVAGTGFWGLTSSGNGCYLRSADVVMFIRIKSLEPVKTMITAYNVYGIGGELTRIKMTTATPVQILGHGVIPRNFSGTLRLQIPTGSGNANAGFFSFKFADSDFSIAVPVREDILDKEIADRYLEPGDTVRGWAFFEYPSPASLPVRLIFNITDDLGHVSSVEIPDEPGNPSGDSLRREFVLTGPTMDLSACTRLPHPTPLQ